MSAEQALLFIDANKYLDLYRTDKGKKLLGPLAEQADYIFITKQIVDEVQRNKLGITADFLKSKNQGMKLQSINIPDHLSGAVNGKTQDILSQMKDISTAVSAINKEIDSFTLAIMKQVATSEDEVSKSLAPIFAKAVIATTDELKRARERKELGNPPGKRNDPIGDELTWEQILSHFKGKTRLWIISRDGDYSTSFGGEVFLNSFLRSELTQITDEPEVHIFGDLVEGLMHFVATTAVKAEVQLTPEEILEIEIEEKALPPVEVDYNSLTSAQSKRTASDLVNSVTSTQLSSEIQRSIASLLGLQSSPEIQKMIGGMHTLDSASELQKMIGGTYRLDSAAELQKIIDGMYPLDSASELQKMMSGMYPLDSASELQKMIGRMHTLEPSSEIQNMIAGIQASQPSSEAQRMLAEMQSLYPFEDLRKTLALMSPLNEFQKAISSLQLAYLPKNENNNLKK